MRFILTGLFTLLLLFPSHSQAQIVAGQDMGFKISYVSLNHFVNKNDIGYPSNFSSQLGYGIHFYKIFRQQERLSIQAQLGYYSASAGDDFFTRRVFDEVDDTTPNEAIEVNYSATYGYVSLPIMFRLQTFTNNFSTYFLMGGRFDYMVNSNFTTNNEEYGQFFYGYFYDETKDYSYGLIFGVGLELPFLGTVTPLLEATALYDLMNAVEFETYAYSNMIFMLSLGIRF